MFRVDNKTKKIPAEKTVLVYLIVMGIIHECNFLVFPVDLVHEDIMTDVQAPESPERFFQGLTNLRIFCKFSELLLYLAEPCRVFLPHFPEYGFDFGIRDYREVHCLIFRMKSSIEEYVFPFPFDSPDSASLIFFTYADLMTDSGG